MIISSTHLKFLAEMDSFSLGPVLAVRRSDVYVWSVNGLCDDIRSDVYLGNVNGLCDDLMCN